MKIRFVTMLSVCSCLGAFSSCQTDHSDKPEPDVQNLVTTDEKKNLPDDKWIEGTWRYSEQPGPGLAILLHYSFSNGTVKYNGYPPFSVEGQYKVTEQSPNHLTLQVSKQKGDQPQMLAVKLVIVLNREKQTITVNGKGPFTFDKP